MTLVRWKMPSRLSRYDDPTDTDENPGRVVKIQCAALNTKDKIIKLRNVFKKYFLTHSKNTPCCDNRSRANLHLSKHPYTCHVRILFNGGIFTTNDERIRNVL